MANEPSPPSTTQSLDALKNFNEFQAQSRARGEAALKLVMGISGGMLTLSIGAVLGGAPTKIPSDLLPSLQVGWCLLFFCIAASLLLMCSMIIATFHMGVQWRKALENKGTGNTFIATWPWLRIANGVLAFLILCCFLGGTALVAKVAIGVASVANNTAPIQESIPSVVPPTPNSAAPKITH